MPNFSRTSVIWTVIVFFSIQFKLLYCKKLNPDEVKNEWIPNFSRVLSDFTDDVLAFKKIQNDITNHRKGDTMKTMSTDIDNSIFQKMSYSINERFTGVKNAAFTIKDTYLKDVTVSPISSYERCCKPVPSRHLRYESRLRQDVNTNKACVGSTNGTAIPKLNIHKYYDVFKDNYDRIPSILWQYFATFEDFIEYPDSNKHMCDEHGNINSPLTEYLFALKHSKAEKNIVIVINSDLDPIARAARMLLQTLTPNDKVNVVDSSKDPKTPADCSNRLFIANKKNTETIEHFLSTTGSRTNISTGLEIAYQLLKNERVTNKESSVDMMDIIVLLTDGKDIEDDVHRLFTMIDKYQGELGRTVSHTVFTVGPLNDTTRAILTNIAEQHVPNWPMGLNVSLSGPSATPNQNGRVHFFMNTSDFPEQVASAFLSSIPETTNTDREYTIIAPVIDKNIGVKMTTVVPVKNKNGTVIGTAAVDVALATLFSEIQDFVYGVYSYAFLLEKMHGHVLLHPKLKSPEYFIESRGDDVFPSIRDIEPDLDLNSISKLVNGIDKIGSFSAKMRPGRTTFMTQNSLPPENATILFQHLMGTQFIMVMVMFNSEEFFTKPPFPMGNIPNTAYHRIDIRHDYPVCSTDGHTVSNMAATVKVNTKYVEQINCSPGKCNSKLSPVLFVESQRYQITIETRKSVEIMSDFLKGKNNTAEIKEDLKTEIWHSLIETQHVDKYWRDSNKHVIERFYASPIGVFKLFPGVVLENSFDHLQYKWYKKTVSRYEDIVVSTGKISHYVDHEVVILTKALMGNKSNSLRNLITDLQGVVGATLTKRQLIALFYDSITDCTSANIECHLLDNEGYFLTFETESEIGQNKYHLANKYPWLVNRLLYKGLLQLKWCTSFSDGFHKLSYSFTNAGLTYDLPSDECKQYVLGSVNGTNIFILLVNRRDICKDVSAGGEKCLSCESSNTKCISCLQTNRTVCQCPCLCDVDFDRCSDELYRTHTPHQACFYEQPQRNITEIKQIVPTRPCKTPCPTMEEQKLCDANIHCVWTANDTVPLCIQKPILQTGGPLILVPTKPTKKIIIPTKPSLIVPVKNSSSKPTTPQSNMSRESSSMNNFTSALVFRPISSRGAPNDKSTTPSSDKTLQNTVTPTTPSTDKTLPNTVTPTTPSTDKTLPSTESHANETTAQNRHFAKQSRTGLVIGITGLAIVVVVIGLLLLWKGFGKNILESMRKKKAGRYVRHGSDHVTFNKMDDTVNITHENDEIPYGKMTG